MSINKVVVGGRTLIDLTGDTVRSSDILRGKTAHIKSGEKVSGTCDFDVDSSRTTATSSDILNGKTAAIKGSVTTGNIPIQNNKSFKIRSPDEVINIPKGYYNGEGTVSLPEKEKEFIIPTNIREGITILGIKGSIPNAEMIFYDGIEDDKGNLILDDKFDPIAGKEKLYEDVLLFKDPLLDSDGNKILDSSMSPIYGRIIYKKYEEV